MMLKSMLPRASVVVVAVAAAALAVIGVTEGDWPLAGVAALAAVAFATNLLRRMPKAARVVMLAIQGLAMLAMAAVLVVLLSIADAGTNGWEQAPWWFWLGVVAAFLFSVKAVAEGYRVYREA